MIGNKATNDLLKIHSRSNVSLGAPTGEKPDNFQAYNSQGEIILPEDLPVQKAGLAGQAVENIEFELRFIDGQSVWLFGNAVPLKNEKGLTEGAIGAFIDITEQKKMKEQLQLRTAQLETMQTKLEENAVLLEEYANQMEQLANERLQKLKDAERLATIGQTAGMVGHDIRNPLQAITGDLYLISQEAKDMPDNQTKQAIEESIDSINESLNYVNKIVSDLQDYTRPLKPSIEEVNLQQLVKSTIAKLNPPGRIDVRTVIIEEILVKTDADYLRRILTNLFTNAIQAMPDEGKLTIVAYKEGQKVVISVRDTGVGIAEEVKQNLFTPLFTTKSKGQGLGLTAVKRLVEALHGKVSFVSQEGKGTLFTVELPLVE